MENIHKKQYKKIERFLDVDQLEERIKNQTPKSGQYFYDYKLEEAKKQQQLLKSQTFHKKYKINFSDLPISRACIKGLTSRDFIKMTEIQRCVIPHALADRDIMAASRTGSGKTLCYLIPLIEKLYRHKFIPIDGLGAIVVVPVRELAIQVFQVLNSFTSGIEINVGLVIGGKDVRYEKQRINSMNVLICTPGRLLQHLQQTYGFEANNLQMVVLDQADMMMQMGFESTLKSIIEYLPRCQTLLFSATLNNQVKLLANLSMNEPEKIFLHEKDGENGVRKPGENIYEIPVKLVQYYMIVEAEQKLNTLYSFIKAHQREKLIVFISTCKQVRFLYECLKKFRLGLPLYELQGHQKQKKRMAIYFTFSQKKYAVLISTNIAARGLDFPMVDWVIQYDVPENAETYVHRVGRTARFKYEGKALTFVSKNQLPFIDELKSKNINIHKIRQNPEKYLRIEASLQSICSQHQQVKYLAQRAMISYLKFIHKATNKQIFNIDSIDTGKLAQSFGLVNAPIIQIKKIENKDDSNNNQNDDMQENKQEKIVKLKKIEKLRLKSKLKKNQIKEKKNRERLVHNTNQQENEDKFQPQPQQSQQKYHSSPKPKHSKIPTNQKPIQHSPEDNNSNQLFKLKTQHRYNPTQKPILTVTKNRMKKIRNQGPFDGRNKIHFDEEMNPITDEQYLRRQYLNANKININIEPNFINRIYENKILDEKEEKKRRKDKRMKINQRNKICKGEIVAEKEKYRKVGDVGSQDEEQGEQMEDNQEVF